MKLDLFVFTYQDIMLPFFIDYYKNVVKVDSFTFIDSGSEPQYLKMMKNVGNIIPTGLKTWDWDVGQIILQNVWKESKADFVLFPNADEIFYHPTNLRKYLQERVGKIDIFQMRGYQMVSPTFAKPRTNILDIKKGVPIPLYNKFFIFNPKSDIEFVNAHDIRTASTKLDRYNVMLLHYKYLGVQEQIRRANLVRQRVPKDSFCKGIEANILQKYPNLIQTRERYQAEINDLLKKAEGVIE